MLIRFIFFICFLGSLYSSQPFTFKGMDPAFPNLIFGLARMSSDEAERRAANLCAKYNQLLQENTDSKIENLSHRVWVTPDGAPVEISDTSLQSYDQGITKMGAGWKQKFWCLNPDKIPNTVKFLRGKGVEINTIELDSFICVNLIKRLINHGYLTFASDLIRKEIVLKEGGVYFDIGMLQLVDLSKYLKFETLLLSRTWGELDVGVLGSIKGSPFLRTNLEYIKFYAETFQYYPIPYPKIAHCFLSSYSMMAQAISCDCGYPIGFIQEDKDVKVNSTGSWKANYLPPAVISENQAELMKWHFLPYIHPTLVCPSDYLGDMQAVKNWENVLWRFGICSVHNDDIPPQSKDYEKERIPVIAMALTSAKKECSELEYVYQMDHAGTPYSQRHYAYTLSSTITSSLQVGLSSSSIMKQCYSSIPLLFTLPKSEHLDANVHDPKLFFCGGYWDGRYNQLMNLLDEQTEIFDWYGPAKYLGGRRCYRGFVDNLLDTMRKTGIALVFHSAIHIANAEPSLRIFEAAASGAVAISDMHPFVMENFGDSVLYVDHTLSAEQMFQQIMQHYNWVKANPQAALEKTKRAHQIFVDKYCLEKIAMRFIAHHQECVIYRTGNPLPPRLSFAYSYTTAEEVNTALSIMKPENITVTNETPILLENFLKVQFIKQLQGDIVSESLLKDGQDYGCYFALANRLSSQLTFSRFAEEDTGRKHTACLDLKNSWLFRGNQGDTSLYFPPHVFLTGIDWKAGISSIELSYFRKDERYRMVVR